MLEVQTRVVDQHIDGAEALDDLLPKPGRAGRIGEIRGKYRMTLARKRGESRFSSFPVAASIARNTL